MTLTTHRTSRGCRSSTAARCARRTRSTIATCSSSRPTACRPSTSSSSSRSRTRARCSRACQHVVVRASSPTWVRSHFVSADPAGLPEPARDAGAGAAIDARAPCRAGRRRVRRARLPRRLGLGGVPAQRSGVRPSRCPTGCARPIACPSRSSRRRPRRRSVTTRTSRREQLAEMVGADLARQLEERSIALYVEGARRAEAVGLILADTKFEFGFIDGELAVIDEVLTPDSSPVLGRRAVRAGLEPAELRQAVRARLRRRVRLEQGAAGADAPGRGDRRHARPLRRRLRAPHRSAPGRDRRALAGRGARRAATAASPIRRARRSGPRSASLGYDSVERGPQRQAACASPSRPTTTRPPRPRSPRCAAACSPTR